MSDVVMEQNILRSNNANTEVERNTLTTENASQNSLKSHSSTETLNSLTTAQDDVKIIYNNISNSLYDNDDGEYTNYNDIRSHLLNQESQDYILSSTNPQNDDDDQFDLQRIKREALNMSDEANFVHDLNIYDFKQESPLDLDCDIGNEFLRNDNENFNFNSSAITPLSTAAPIEQSEMAHKENTNSVVNQQNSNDEYHGNNNETDDSDVSSIFREHNYMSLDQMPSMSSRATKPSIKNKSDLKMHLQIIQEYTKNEMDENCIDKEILELGTKLYQQFVSRSKISNSESGKLVSNGIAQDNLAILLEACEIRDAKTVNVVNSNKEETIDKTTTENRDNLQLNDVEHENDGSQLIKSNENAQAVKRSEETVQYQSERRLILPKIKSEIKSEMVTLVNCGDNERENEISSELNEDISLPSIPDIDALEKNLENDEEMQLENLRKEFINNETANSNQVNTEEDTENTSLLFLENRSEPLEYEQSEVNEMNTEDDHKTSQLPSDCEAENNKSNNNNNTKNESLLLNQTDKLKNKVEILKMFCKKLHEDCETNVDSFPDEKEFSEFIAMKVMELKKLAKTFNLNNWTEMETQTDITGEVFKERQKKVNEKMKRQLLLSSSGESSGEEDDDDEIKLNDKETRASQEYLPSTTTCENDTPLVDNNINDENQKLEIFESKVQEKVESEDETETETEPYLIGGLDLSKCLVNTEDILQSDDDKHKGSSETTKDEIFSKNIDEKMECEDIDEIKKHTTSTTVFNDELSDDEMTDKNPVIDIGKDEKLKMEPIVLIEKLSEQKLENYFDELRDKEIDRLLDFRNLMNPKISYSQYVRKKKDEGKKKKQRISFEIFNDTEKESSTDDSNNDEDEKIMTEKEYLEKYNNNLKQQLLNSSSSSSTESDRGNDESDVENFEVNGKSESSSNESEESETIVDKFLKRLKEKDDKHLENKNESDLKTSLLIPSSVEIQENVQFENNLSGNEENKCDEKRDTENDDEEEEEVKDLNKQKKITVNNDAITNDDDDETILKTGNERENKNEKSRFRDRIYDSSRKILTEKEFDIETFAKDNDDNKENSESSDCEILDDIRHQKRHIKQKSVETLVEEAAKRKCSVNSKTVDDLISLSSASEPELEEITVDEEARKRFLKPMLRQDQLAGETRVAQKQEAERIRRLDKKQKMMKEALEKYKSKNLSSQIDSELILDYNPDTDTFIKVHSDIVKHMKPHQIDGVKFIYDNCYGSVKDLKNNPGSGCILAHCMGLGKTFQLVALIHTVINHKELNTSKILILCPKSTVMNWCDEIRHWLHPFKKNNIKLYHFPDMSDIQTKLKMLEEWSQCGTTGIKRPGVFLIGYEAFRTLVFYHLYKKKGNYLTAKEKDLIEQKIKKCLLQPGADLVICDEGHIIKNRKAAISAAVAQIKTPRRIILTGTPIQNNLKEYYSMVNFIKPSFLGTEREFANLYANPIKNGQHKDSSKREIKIMKQRSFVLHKKLSKFVQRKEAALLKTFLPRKFEYVLFIPMTKVQNRLYEYFLKAISKRSGSKGKSLIPDYTCLRKIWTHPKVLEIAWKNATEKGKKEALPPPPKVATPILNSDDELPDDVYDSQTGELSVTNDWWRPLVTQEDLVTLLPSNKLLVMFEILRMCEENKEKCLIFSAFVAVLNVVEYFMQQIHKQNHEFLNNTGFERFKGPWVANKDYYRLDGKTSKTLRHGLIKQFNNPQNTTTRCFLISAKAGGQGINLVGANRVIILDTSWNPSNDQQNIFRIYRLGQEKKCYVYRLLSMGTMEEKVYSRSVTKQAMSFRVVDEQQIDRHYSMAELTELYTLTEPNYAERPVPVLPQDNILANLLRNYPNLAFKYHEHDSLLENKIEQELSEEEKADAWAQYERDLHLSQDPAVGAFDNQGMPPYNPMRAGYNQGNYPMPYGLSPLSMSGLNYSPANPIFNLYNMYQNFPDYSSLMSSLNQPGTSSMGGFQSPYPPNFMQPSSSNLSSNVLTTPNSNGMPLGNLAQFNALNTSPSPHTSSYITTPSSSYATAGLYPPSLLVNSAPTNNPDSFFADLRKLLESSSNPNSLSSLTSFDTSSKNQPQQSNSMTPLQNKLSSSSAAPISSPSGLLLNAIQNATTVDAILTNVIRKPDTSSSSSPTSSSAMNLISKANNPRASSEVESAAANMIQKNSAGIIHISKGPSDTSNTVRNKSLPNLNDQNKSSKRTNNIGILYSDKSSPSTNLNSSLASNSAAAAAAAAAALQRATNISVRTVNSINEVNNQQQIDKTYGKSLKNNAETELTKNQKEKPFDLKSSKTPTFVSRAAMVQQQTKNTPKQTLTNTSGAINISKSIATSGGKISSSNLMTPNLQIATGTGAKNLLPPSASSSSNKSTISPPSLVLPNKTYSRNVSAKTKIISSASSLKTSAQNKVTVSPYSIGGMNNKQQVQNPNLSKNLPEMIRVAVAGKNYQTHTPQLQTTATSAVAAASAGKGNIRSTAMMATNPSQTNPISGIKSQQSTVLNQRNVSNNKRIASRNVKNKSLPTIQTPVKNVIITANKNMSSNIDSGSGNNVGGNLTMSNQLINMTNKNVFNSLTNKSELSIRPVDNTKPGIIVTTPPRKSNVSGVSGVSPTIPIITQVTSLNTSSLNNNTLNSVKGAISVLSKKRPATTNLDSMASMDDAPVSIRQIKKVKKSVTNKTASPAASVSESLIRIQSAQGLSVFPKTVSKTQTKTKNVNEGKRQEVVELD